MPLLITRVKSFGKNTFNYTGILVWSELPTEIKCLKNVVKLFLFNNHNDQEASSYICLTWSYIFQVIYIYIHLCL